MGNAEQQNPDTSWAYETNGEVSLTAVLGEHAQNPPGGDPYIGALLSDILSEPEDSVITIATKAMIAARLEHVPHTKPEALANLVRSTYSYYFLPDTLERQSPTFDPAKAYTYAGKNHIGANKADLHRAATDFMSTDQSFKAQTALAFLVFSNLQTTMNFRYAATGLLMRITEERFPHEGALWVDHGASVGVGAYQIMHNEQQPLAFKIVSLFDGTRQPFEKSVQPLKAASNALLLGKMPVAQAVCLDREAIYQLSKNRVDPSKIDWAKANIRPTEYLNPTFMHQFAAIQGPVPDTIDHLQINIADDIDYTALKQYLHGRRVNVITAITALYESSPRDLERIVERILSVINLSKQGLAYFQDANSTLAGIGSDYFAPPADIGDEFNTPGQYSGSLYDNRLPDEGIQPAFRFQGTRAQEISIETDALVMYRGQPTRVFDAIYDKHRRLKTAM